MRAACFILPVLGLLASPIAAKADEPALFDQPAQLCGALIQQGLVPGKWGRTNQGFEGTEFRAYNCLSPIMLIPGGNGGVFVTSINFFAEGRTNDKVEIVKLVLNVHDRSNRDAGREKFVAASKALFKALDIHATETFLRSLQQPRNDTLAFDGGRVRFEVWSVPVERERLTIESSTALQR